MKNSKRLLAGPYLFWAVSCIIIPLIMIFYYGLTDNDGKFTWMNLAKITTPENLKALGLALLLAFVSTVICLILAYPLRKKCKPVQLRSTCFHPSDVDELSAQNSCMAEPPGEKRCHQLRSPFLRAAFMEHYQHTDSDHPRYGLQLPAVHGAADLQCTCKD